RARKVDLRIVAATHRDLDRDVEAGRFRQDLLFRLAVARVRLPPLRERLEDLPVLARALLAEAGATLPLSDETLAVLRSYAWPGNVGELRNVLMRTATFGGAIELANDSSAPAAAAPTKTDEPPPDEKLPVDYRRAKEVMTARFEQAYL